MALHNEAPAARDLALFAGGQVLSAFGTISVLLLFWVRTILARPILGVASFLRDFAAGEMQPVYKQRADFRLTGRPLPDRSVLPERRYLTADVFEATRGCGHNCSSISKLRSTASVTQNVFCSCSRKRIMPELRSKSASRQEVSGRRASAAASSSLPRLPVARA